MRLVSEEALGYSTSAQLFWLTVFTEASRERGGLLKTGFCPNFWPSNQIFWLNFWPAKYKMPPFMLYLRDLSGAVLTLRKEECFIAPLSAESSNTPLS